MTPASERTFPKGIEMKTFSQKNETVEKKWILIDAEGLVVGRLASLVALRLLSLIHI